jgi:cyclase
MWISSLAGCGGTRRAVILRRPPRWPTKDLGIGAAVLAACLLSARALFPAGWLYQVRELKPGVFLWHPEDVIEEEGDPQFTRAANAGFVITNDGVLVVGTTNSPFHAREVLYEIRQRTQAPVRYVVDTDASGDAMLGNEVFEDLQASILSTPEAQADMRKRRDQLAHELAGDTKLQRQMRGIHFTPAGDTFAASTVLHLDSVEIRLERLDTGTASGDAAVFLPSAKVCFLGDLFANAFFPRAQSGDEPRDFPRWIAALRQAEAWDADLYVPGHGEPGSKKDLEQSRQFLEWLWNEISHRVQAGKSLAQTKHDLVPQLEARHWGAPELAPALVDAAYAQASAVGRSGP